MSIGAALSTASIVASSASTKSPTRTAVAGAAAQSRRGRGRRDRARARRVEDKAQIGGAAVDRGAHRRLGREPADLGRRCRRGAAAAQCSRRSRPSWSSCRVSASICASSRCRRGSSPPACCGGGSGAGGLFLGAKGRQHLQRALEQRHVLLAHLLELAEREDAEGRLQALAHLLLVAVERDHRLFEVTGHQKLHAVAVEPDQLAQKADRQQVLALLLLLDDDLGQHRAGDVLAGLGVMSDEIAALLDQLGEIVERDIAARRRVVEPPVGVFLDDDRLGRSAGLSLFGVFMRAPSPVGNGLLLREYSVLARSPHQTRRRAARCRTSYDSITYHDSRSITCDESIYVRDDRSRRPRPPLSGAVGGISDGVFADAAGESANAAAAASAPADGWRRHALRRSPDRRLAPRPLPAHLTSAMRLWLSSRAALPFLKSVSPPSSAAPAARLRALAAEIDAFGPEPVAAALDARSAPRRGLSRRARGLSPPPLPPRRRRRPVVWREGATRLLDYGGDPAAPAVLVVPSLINRYYVLDLLPERSFVRHLAEHGLRPLVVDWERPGPPTSAASISPAMSSGSTAPLPPPSHRRRADRGARLLHGRPVGAGAGIAAPARRSRASALLATPWDFHAERRPRRGFSVLPRVDLPQLRRCRNVPVELRPELCSFCSTRFSPSANSSALPRSIRGCRGARFCRARGLDQRRRAARSPVARECLRLVVRRQRARPGRVAGRGPQGRPRAAASDRHSSSFPARDRIVPPRSAEPLAAAPRRCDGDAAAARPCRDDGGRPRAGDAVGAGRGLAAGAPGGGVTASPPAGQVAASASRLTLVALGRDRRTVPTSQGDP